MTLVTSPPSPRALPMMAGQHAVDAITEDLDQDDAITEDLDATQDPQVDGPPPPVVRDDADTNLPVPYNREVWHDAVLMDYLRNGVYPEGARLHQGQESHLASRPGLSL
jgi:hypothetical protein